LPIIYAPSFSASTVGPEAEERLIVLDAARVLGQNLDDLAGDVGDDLVHHLHRLDDAEDLTRLDGVPHLDVGLLARRGRPVECADERRADRVQAVGIGDDLGGFRGGRLGRQRRAGGRGRGLRHRLHADLRLPKPDSDLPDPALAQQLDYPLDLV
jgi:hypothetical protein